MKAHAFGLYSAITRVTSDLLLLSVLLFTCLRGGKSLVIYQFIILLMDEQTMELLAPFNKSEYENELQAVECAEREADKDNEREHVEAGLPFYKLSE